MRLALHAASKPREITVCEAFLEGARAAGDIGAVHLDAPVDWIDEAADVAVLIGVKRKATIDRYVAAGKHWIFVDKGYARIKGLETPEALYWKVSVDAFQPLAYFMADDRPPDRFEALAKRYGFGLKPWRKRGDVVVIAGHSAKNAQFHGTDADPNAWAEAVAAEVARRIDLPIIYKPKRSWPGARPIANAGYSDKREKWGDLLARAWCVVTHNSNISFAAVVAGVPVIALGPAIARPISSISLDDVGSPRLASEDERLAWARAVAYCQWTVAELRMGACWRDARRHLTATDPGRVGDGGQDGRAQDRALS